MTDVKVWEYSIEIILARNANGDSVPAGDFIVTTTVPIPAVNGFGMVEAALLLSIVGLVSIIRKRKTT